MAVSQAAEKIGRAMGLEHMRDNKGRSVRKYYAAQHRDRQVGVAKQLFSAMGIARDDRDKR
jgi:hypothetical protein